MCVCVYVYIYHIFIHSSVDKHIGCFHILAIVNSAAVNIGMHVSFELVFFFSGAAGSHSNSIFHFVRNLRSILHSGCASLHSHQQCRRAPFLHTLSKNRMVTSIQSTAQGLKLGASRGAAEVKTMGLKR